jgi:bifunctional DNA-binding transcriptional regulator/antitoxin component of YhaV-PrlF toxin-antitoxin module
MKEIVTTIMGGNQLTLPIEVRQQLGLEQGDRVAFLINDDGDVALRAASPPPAVSRPSIASLRGAAGSLVRPLSWEEIKDIVNEDRAAAQIEKLQPRGKADNGRSAR